MKIEHAELQLHPGKIGVVVEHALERADRRLVVAKLGLELGVTESGVEIVGFDQQALEQEVGRDALVRIGSRARPAGRGGRRRGRSAGRLRESGGGAAKGRADESHRRRQRAGKPPRRAGGPRNILLPPLHQADPSFRLYFLTVYFSPNATGFSNNVAAGCRLAAMIRPLRRSR